MWLDSIILQNREQLTKNDMEIIEAMKHLEGDISRESITNLAQQLHISKSSLSRLTQKLGFLGYGEFRYQWRQHYAASLEQRAQQQDLHELLEKDIRDTFRLAKKTDFTPFIEIIESAQIVYCYGTGNSQRKAVEEFSRLLITLNKRAIVVPFAAELRMSANMIQKNDALIVCSLSGDVTEIYDLLQDFRQKGVAIVGITKFSQNTLEELADFSAFYYATPFNRDENDRIRTTLSSMSILLDHMYRSCYNSHFHKKQHGL